MKIAVTAMNSEPTSEVSAQFARAPWVLVYDTDTKAWESHSNQEIAKAAHGAGPQAAENLSRLGAEVVITGACGPNAYQALSAAGIKVLAGSGRTVQEAVQDYERGQLRELTGSNGPNG